MFVICTASTSFAVWFSRGGCFGCGRTSSGTFKNWRRRGSEQTHGRVFRTDSTALPRRQSADVTERTDGGIVIGTSSLYAAIRQMLRDGLIADADPRDVEPSSGPPRRYYAITDLGSEVAKLEAQRLRGAAAAAEVLLGSAPTGT